MPDGLIVSGGGSVVVASDELRRQAAELGELSGALSEVRRLVLAATDRHGGQWLTAVDAPISAQRAERAATNAAGLLARSEAQAESVARAVRWAMYTYGLGEAATTHLLKNLHAELGYAVGRLGPILAVLALPALGSFAAGAILSGAIRGRSPGEVLGELGAWARSHAAVLTDSVTVALVKGAMHSSDDVLGGLLQLPEPVVRMLGEEGIDIAGLSTTALAVTVLGRSAGLLLEGPVVVSRSTTGHTTPPRSLAGRVGRIPQPGANGGDQIRIDRYSTPGQPDRFEVYVAGTVDSSIASGDEPWDMTSNITAIAGGSAASVVAVQAAMAQAGITASSPVVLTGHSQGGLVAATVAATGQYNVQGVVTFGAPTGFIEIPATVPVLNVRHTDDIVPALGGYDTSLSARVVEREVYTDRPVPTDRVFPAHQLSNYLETAVRVDNSPDPELEGALAVLHNFAGVGSGGLITTVAETETTTYRAHREAD
jgi:hypothetical protein